jgi:predicted small secreted protein
MRRLVLAFIMSLSILGSLTACNTAAGIATDVNATVTCVADAATGTGCNAFGTLYVQ